ncbi:hypothetical protein AURDEDRAFT_176013 [Auricularia subglabra TFB-10046 SS5]|uniref:Uncharacterized protein n=1 Tax=Auricularia subglabra (strain TFB-10046 / SS5) TaxID=717982 RepID=J0WS80_AURST|nr:hypothetical protein AURDEDRAFT_176013 [Auricularia subglabra TFB-10046 SS5]
MSGDRSSSPTLRSQKEAWGLPQISSATLYGVDPRLCTGHAVLASVCASPWGKLCHFAILTDTYLIPFILHGPGSHIPRPPALVFAERLLGVAFVASLIPMYVEAVLWVCGLVDRQGVPTVIFTGVFASAFVACQTAANKFFAAVYPPGAIIFAREVYEECNAMWVRLHEVPA